MTTNFTDLSNEELDKLASKMMGFQCSGTLHGYVVWEYNSDKEPINHIHNWNPTKDAEQIQRYLFPKLESKGCSIVEERFCVNMLPHYEIRIYKVPIPEFKRNIISGHICEYYEMEKSPINRTKVIACLEAMEKIKEKS